MLRKAVFVVGVIALILGGLGPVTLSAQAQTANELTILALESARTPVEAWATAFGETTDVSISILFAATEDELMTHSASADVLIYEDYEAEPSILFECGFVSRAYVLLPGLGGRFLADNSCGGTFDAQDMLAKDFLKFATSADGQQVAIDLGLLPAAVEVVDQAGITVRVPQPVRRVVAAYGVATYYLYPTAVSDRLVAAAYIGVRTPQAQEAMRWIDPRYDTLIGAVSVMGQKEANIEEIAALNPDLLLVSARTAWLDAAAELGIPMIRFQGETPERLQEALNLVGTLFGPDAAYWAAQYNAYYNAVLEDILDQTATIDTPVKVYFSGTEPLRVASGDMYQTAMIEAAGGVSVSKALTGSWNDVNLEQVLLWNPDIIFVPTYGGATVEAITESPEWAAVPAVQAGQVYQFPEFTAPWDTPVPDSILGIIWMANKLHPGRLTLSCAEEAIFFYSTFYEYSMSEKEAQSLCQ